MSNVCWIFGGEERDFKLDSNTVAQLTEKGEKAAADLIDLPLETIMDTLARTGRMWRKDSAFYREAFEGLSRILPFSEAMIAHSLDLIPGLLDRSVLEERVRLELGDVHALDYWRRPGFDGALKAFPLGLLLHVSAGNVFLGALDSIVMALLTKNASIVKLSSADPFFPLLFARSLAKSDDSGLVARALALIPWKGGDKSVEEPLKRAADGIIVWGGAKAVEAYRHGLGPATRLIEHGPKMSFAVCLDSCLDRSTAGKLAWDIALWDQAACSSPQFAFIEGDMASACDFARLLAKELGLLAGKLPPGSLDIHEQVELTKLREMAAMDKALGEGLLLMPETRDSAWTVTVSSRKTPEASPLNRSIVLYPYRTPDELLERLSPLRPYLQSVGIAGPSNRVSRLVNRLGSLGACRFTKIGSMGEGLTGAPHDGRFGLEDLVRLVDCERFCPIEPDRRLRDLLDYVRANSSFWRERIPEGASLRDLPFTTSEDIVRNVPPGGRSLLTGDEKEACVFASGGSTGAPKYTFYTYSEFDETARFLARCFTAAGLDARSRAANLFVAGNLWTSFLAVHKALENIGCFNIPIGGTSDLSRTLAYIIDFRADVLLGIPSVLLELARIVEADAAKDSLAVKLVLYAGEHLTESTAERLSDSFGGPVVRSAGYASVDAGTIAYQCPHCAGGWHHLLTAQQYLEFLHPETGIPVGPGEVGELVATNLIRRLQPVIRMKTGDLGRFTERKCECGADDLLFELLGRSDDRVFVGGARFMAADVARLAGSIKGLTSQVQIVIEGQDKLTLLVETDGSIALYEGTAGSGDDLAPVFNAPGGTNAGSELPAAEADTASDGRTAAALEFSERFIREIGDVAVSVENGWLLRPSVELLPPGGIARVKRTGKIKRVIDRRRQ